MDVETETALRARGFCAVAGLDEAGRGPLAGPLVCAAVILPLQEEARIAGVDDSKRLSPRKREVLCERIRERALCFCIRTVDVKTIDEINILQATRLGMKLAAEGLSPAADYLLTDGNMTLDVAVPQRSIVGGDARVYSIAAASILAKVFRDSLMAEYDVLYPGYGFARNKGYGTAEHIAAIRERGICEIHRRTFVKKFWDGREKT